MAFPLLHVLVVPLCLASLPSTQGEVPATVLAGNQDQDPVASPGLALTPSLVASILPRAEEARASGPTIWSEEAKLAPADQKPPDLFGFSVAVEGDVAVIGSPRADGIVTRSGVVYVYLRQNGVWVESQKLAADDGENGGFFGGSVAISKNTIVVGAVVSSPRGAAYVFTLKGSAWSFDQKLEQESPVASFGTSVAISGNVIVIGADSSSHAAPGAPCDSGSAHVYRRMEGAWREEAVLLASDLACGADFGESVSIDEGMIVVGAQTANGASARTGAAYVFRRIGGNWKEVQKLYASDGEDLDGYGRNVSVSGRHLAVGAPYDDEACPSDPQCGSGSAYVYEWLGSHWVLQKWIGPGLSIKGDTLGFSVSISQDVLAIGSTQYSRAVRSQGAIYAFRRGPSGWQFEDLLTGSNPEVLDGLGLSVAVSGTTLFGGGPSLGGPGLGAAYSFTVPSAGAVLRNAGANPQSYDVAHDPIIGGEFQGTVDLAGSSGHPFALLFGYQSSLSLVLPGGQSLLINIADPSGELLKQQPKAGPSASFIIAIPPDSTLAGLRLFTQAAQFGGEVPWVLSNAQDLTVGF